MIDLRLHLELLNVQALSFWVRKKGYWPGFIPLFDLNYVKEMVLHSNDDLVEKYILETFEKLRVSLNCGMPTPRFMVRFIQHLDF
jgi:hypothetical protein